MYNPPDTPRGLLCPKCAYDLRGTMGDWSNACPLRGICPECGLEFEWADMIGTRRRGWMQTADVLSEWFGLSPTQDPALHAKTEVPPEPSGLNADRNLRFGSS